MRSVMGEWCMHVCMHVLMLPVMPCLLSTSTHRQFMLPMCKAAVAAMLAHAIHGPPLAQLCLVQLQLERI